jgi:predicted exporter
MSHRLGLFRAAQKQRLDHNRCRYSLQSLLSLYVPLSKVLHIKYIVRDNARETLALSRSLVDGIKKAVHNDALYINSSSSEIHNRQELSPFFFLFIFLLSVSHSHTVFSFPHTAEAFV